MRGVGLFGQAWQVGRIKERVMRKPSLIHITNRIPATYCICTFAVASLRYTFLYDLICPVPTPEDAGAMSVELDPAELGFKRKDCRKGHT